MSKEADTLKVEVKGDKRAGELIVRAPNLADIRGGQRVYNSTYRDAIESGAFMRIKLDDFAKQQGIWDDTKQARYTAIRQELLDIEKKLDEGGFKLSEGKELAIQMIKLRNELRVLISDRTDLDNKSAEGQADNAKFSYLASVCLVYKDNGKPYYTGLDDYLNNGSDEAAIWGATKLSSLLYGLDNNFEAKLPDFKFLKEFGFVDEKLRFINKNGKLVDSEGRLIDEEGRFINEKNEFVDKDGNRVDKEGNYLVERKPFLDDEGNPIIVVNGATEMIVGQAATAIFKGDGEVNKNVVQLDPQGAEPAKWVEEEAKK